jgi:Haem-binding domain
MVRKILIVLLVILVVIQFFRPKKNQWDEALANSHSITAVYKVPDDVHQVLSVACYDCHSNNTRYPWYNNIQPVAWWLNDHVQEGKSELNFDEFATYRAGKQYHKLEEVIDQVKKAEMPLDSYTWIHRDAILSEADKQRIMLWAEGIRTQMRAMYPADSLKSNRPPKQG